MDIGFKCGIEIHQQLDTQKLFCRCPSIVHDTGPDIFFERKLRAVTGETGHIDRAAAYEQSRNKIVKYEACSTSSCLVEMDEEPPRPANMDALMISLQIAGLLHCKIVDEVQFMRKIVIDGSNVTGFQRTALVGMDGYLETSQGKVKIENVCLEEEAAQKVEDTTKYIKYRLDRLGVPLVEIATDASIKSPQHAKDVASKIGMILRSTGKVKRGIGSIRQDVNVSIRGGARIEIKGFQDLKSIPRVIDNEIRRQQCIIQKKQNVAREVRKAMPDFSTSFLRPMPGSARLYPETDVLPIAITRKMLSSIGKVELIEEKIEKLVKKGINRDTATQIVKSNIDITRYKCEPKIVALSMIDIPKDIKAREKLDTRKIKEKDYDELFDKIASGKIRPSKDAIRDILIKKIRGIRIDYSSYRHLDTKEIEKEIKKIISQNSKAPMGAIMGIVMSRLRGKADGKTVSEIVRKNMG